jgi:uncharacterized protein YjbI with pentapeptide repeats
MTSATDRKRLRARWKTAAGRIAAGAIENGLRAGASQQELGGYVRDLPHADEVAPALDLRGIELPQLIAVRTRDLTSARLDGAVLNWSFGGSDLRDARFDGAQGHNVHFGGCPLTGASFVDARLPGAIFLKADLQRAEMRGIHMRGGQLKDADCRGAILRGADLRMVWAAGADLRGADLRDANLVGASLGGAQWDEQTRWEGARLSVEGTPAELRAQAIAQGVSVESEKAEWHLALLDATREALKGEIRDAELAGVLKRVDELRPLVQADPTIRWANVLRDELPQRTWQAVQRAVQQAASNMGSYLDATDRGNPR